MLRLNITLILFIYIINVYGQDNETYRYPEYKSYNKNLKVYRIKEPLFCKAAEDIEVLPLRCDTIKLNSHYLNKYLYFDNEGRLRKYWTHNAGNDGASEFLELQAYYNTNGELIYMDYSSGCNCDAESGYFVIHNGKIVEHDDYYECWCCEEDKDSIYTAKLADVGKPLPRNISWWDCSSFSNAATLLNVLRVYEYDGNFNIEFSGKEEVYAMIFDRDDNLKLDTLTLNKRDTLFHNGKEWYEDRVILSHDPAKRIRKGNISSFSENGSEFISSYYDIDGNLFLIRYDGYDRISDGNTNKKQNKELFALYIENDIITGCKYYINSTLDGKGESNYNNEKERIIQSLISTRLNKTPYLKRDLSRFLNTKKLKETFSISE